MNVQVARILLHLRTLDAAHQLVIATHPHLLAQIKHRLFPGRLATAGTRRAGSFLRGAGDVEVPHQRMQVLRILRAQSDGRGEVQILLLHRVDVEFLCRTFPPSLRRCSIRP